MKWIIAAVLVAAAADLVPPRVLATVKSPDSRTAIEIRRWARGTLVYRVTRDGQDVLADSPLGLRRADQDFDPAKLTLVGSTDVRAIDERYTMPHGKAHDHHITARERTLHFK